MIIIETHNPSWTDWFTQIKAYLTQRPTLKNAQIEHVGSPSVPGLAAKPIIDMDIVYESKNHFTSLKTELESLNYIHQGDMGITGREAFYYQGNNLPNHNLYLCDPSSIAYKNHIIFRNALRNSKELITQYGELKKKLAGIYPDDIDQYCEAKSEFILSVLEQAGIQENDLKMIQSENMIP